MRNYLQEEEAGGTAPFYFADKGRGDMAKILQFSVKPLGDRRKVSQPRNLTEFLRDAHEQIAKLPDLENRPECDPENFNRILAAKMMRGLLKTRSISEPSFLCGVYAAKVLSRFLNPEPTRRWSVDFLEEYVKTGNPFFYQEAGDHIFRICAVFPEYADRLRRPVKLEGYHEIGAGCYGTFYSLTGKEIGYHMSQNFTLIAGIAHEYAVKSWE